MLPKRTDNDPRKQAILEGLEEERKKRDKTYAPQELLDDWDNTMRLGRLIAQGKAKIVRNEKGVLYTKRK